MTLASIRKEYQRAEFGEDDVAPSPLTQFERWFNEACDAKLPEPTAMTPATVDERGRPSARTVLIKGSDERGLVFFTNYESRKGHELSANNRAALLFFWPELERQIRIEGRVKKISARESDDYFASRPLASRIGAWASPQSQTIPSRTALEARVAAFEAEYGATPPRPPHWGGYRLVADFFEFWQGRPNRLHDRIAYRLKSGLKSGLKSSEWLIERLAP